MLLEVDMEVDFAVKEKAQEELVLCVLKKHTKGKI